ncbi:MAG: hypothetical protein A3D31_01660 [Candidatus Fluviicola riflensis]|nr:MAG: hypothetical protein CHH17_03880 [Candidatus Fluviicola riflensis]OGS76308.1 MAG: hypothetical protein A3D31_01660 [Candidatus Fluviicola riflensis]OGS83148.1 MAG: hypothetical protein A2724_00180 [Fluviicola sp. RIFCSPHIGHO2_01_FULL_43_53]OGS83840.1 MAG: hypothetical protein A3E30_18265 [Fluviicola sp. RIFCSPHIGHO2_12_FULL_43_24]
MAPKILHTPHWKLFILVFGIPFVAAMTLMVVMISMIVSQREPNPEVLFPYIFVFPAIALVGAITQLYWQWSVGTGLQAYLHPDTRLRVKRFKIFFFIPWIYMGAFLLVATIISTQIRSSNGDESSGLAWAIPLFILAFLMHFFSIFCIIYTLYFVAKTLKSVELQREAHFSDYIGEFFLIWFFPVGVWFIQPRINRIVQGNQFNDTSLID